MCHCNPMSVEVPNFGTSSARECSAVSVDTCCTSPSQAFAKHKPKQKDSGRKSEVKHWTAEVHSEKKLGEECEGFLASIEGKKS